MLILDESAVRKFLKMPALIRSMERALRALSAGEVVQPVRVIVPVAEHAGFLGSMPAYTGAQLGAKLVAFYPDNRDVPTHHALIVLFKPETGQPLAVIDGRLITEMRTAAASAAATKLLARPDASVLAILGSGTQAQSHLEALRLVRELREIRVWSPRNAGAFARRFGVRLAHSAEYAVRGADIVVVATTSRTPVLLGEWLSPGAHVNAVGACRPDWRELDDDTLRNAKLYVDSRDAASRESGDVIAAGPIIAEIGEVIAGTKAGRQSAAEVTLFKSVGVAVEDLASAELVHEAYLADQPFAESEFLPGDLDALIEVNRLRANGVVSDLEARFASRFAADRRLAVYGSLAPGRSNHAQLSLLPGTWQAGLAVTGELIDRGWGNALGYPALRWSPRSGEVPVQVLASDELPAHWQRLDGFEGSEYLRILVPVLSDATIVGVANLYASREQA